MFKFLKRFRDPDNKTTKVLKLFVSLSRKIMEIIYLSLWPQALLFVLKCRKINFFLFRLLAHCSWQKVNSYHSSFSLHRVGEDGDWNEMPKIHTNKSETQYVVKGLLPFTVYSFRIRAINKLGESAASKESYYCITLREGKF